MKRMEFVKKGFKGFSRIGKKLSDAGLDGEVTMSVVPKDEPDTPKEARRPVGTSVVGITNRLVPKTQPRASLGATGQKETKHQVALRMAIEGVPKTKDSKGVEYYLGPTSGQVMSWWFDENAHVAKKLYDMFAEGASDDQVLEALVGESHELTALHVRWARGVYDRDLERWADYRERMRTAKEPRTEPRRDSCVTESNGTSSASDKL